MTPADRWKIALHWVRSAITITDAANDTAGDAYAARAINAATDDLRAAWDALPEPKPDDEWAVVYRLLQDAQIRWGRRRRIALMLERVEAIRAGAVLARIPELAR